MCDWLNEACSINHFDRSVRVEKYSIGTSLVYYHFIVYILTIEEKAGILDAQSVWGHAGIIPIILFSDVGNRETSGSSRSLDGDALGISQPGEEM